MTFSPLAFEAGRHDRRIAACAEQRRENLQTRRLAIFAICLNLISLTLSLSLVAFRL